MADLPELFFDDFDDGDYDGWVADSPYHPVWSPPAVLPSPEGYAIWGVGSGYGQDDGLLTSISYPLNLQNVQELAIEMRTITGSGWPSSSNALLYSGLDYYSGLHWGEGNTRADFLIMEGGSDALILSHPMGGDAYNWHDFRWERDADGWWSFYLDDSLIAANYYQHGTFTDFDWLELNPLRNEAAIEWVRIRGNVIPGPGGIALLPLASLVLARRRRS
ncbi:MAG: hypothetical protein ACF8NJ_07415 [Phycisphaerales bacterium JB038]